VKSQFVPFSMVFLIPSVLVGENGEAAPLLGRRL